MYRRALQASYRAIQLVADSQLAGAVQDAGALLAASMQRLSMIQQAERVYRRWNRANKRLQKHTTFHASGLNGARAMQRRRTQIAAGSLR